MVGEEIRFLCDDHGSASDISAGFDEEMEPGDISDGRKLELREQYQAGKKEAVYKNLTQKSRSLFANGQGPLTILQGPFSPRHGNGS